MLINLRKFFLSCLVVAIISMPAMANGYHGAPAPQGQHSYYSQPMNGNHQDHHQNHNDYNHHGNDMRGDFHHSQPPHGEPRVNKTAVIVGIAGVGAILAAGLISACCD